MRFAKLSLVDQLFHTVASPAVAYLLLLIGLALLVFEFFTAGVGIAGVVGAVCIVLACTGLAALPTRPWAVALIVARDARVRRRRAGRHPAVLDRRRRSSSIVVASLFLFEPLPGTTLRPSWITLLAGIGGIVLAFIVGMPSMVRTRFATPTIGREWMIGELGRRPSTTSTRRRRRGRHRPLAGAHQPGDAGRAPASRSGSSAIDGVTLEVEPLEGAARDYRERGSGKDVDGATADARRWPTPARAIPRDS